ncbi:MAG: DUF885 family protein, partial [Porticoccaceae bacterium]|nr:DUF885 family protein [Porticoccaceae bacterium]
QANAYMLGMLEIRRLRDFSERELADNFDLSGFHDRILENGSMTLPMTEKAILLWVASEKSDVSKP